MNYLLGPYTLDVKSRVVWFDATIVSIPPKAIEFLICLVEANGAVVSKTGIRDRVWPDISVEDNSITQIASVIRKAFKPGFGDAEVIETVPRRGYRLAIMPIQVTDSPVVAADSGPPQLISTQAGRQHVPHSSGSATRRIPRLAWALGLIAASVLVVTGARWLYPGSPTIHIYPLTDVTFDESMPSISPDGTQVAYSRKLPGEDVYDLYVKVVGGPPPSRLTHSKSNSMRAAWSPNGELIAYSQALSDHGEVRIVTPLGRGDEMLVRLNTPQVPTTGWSPDSEWLAFADNVRPGGGIFLFSMKSGQQRRLTTPSPRAEDSYPRFSPDGKLVAFLRADDPPGSRDLYVTPVGGGTARRVVSTRSTIQGIAFTHGGADLIFASDMAGTKYLYSVPVSGNNPPVRVATGPDAEEPSLASGLDRLAFDVFYSSELLWRNSVGTDDRQQLALPGFRRLEPRFSPDGKRLAFVANAIGFDEVWVANLDGSAARPLTSGGITSPDALAWSPDGAYIAYGRRVENEIAVWTVPSQGGVPRRMTPADGRYYFPEWSPDGKWLYLSSDRNGHREIWRQPWPAGPLEQVTHDGGIPGTAFARWKVPVSHEAGGPPTHPQANRWWRRRAGSRDLRADKRLKLESDQRRVLLVSLDPRNGSQHPVLRICHEADASGNTYTKPLLERVAEIRRSA